MRGRLGVEDVKIDEGRGQSVEPSEYRCDVLDAT